MTLDERVVYLLLGAEVGFFMGYLTRMLQEIREGVKEVDTFFKKIRSRTRDEKGFLSFDQLKVRNVALFLVVVLTAFAAFQSQKASNKVADTQADLAVAQQQLDAVVECNKTVLADALNALNTRTTYTQSAAGSNLELVKASIKMFDILLFIPPYPVEVRFKATQDYNKAAQDFVKAQAASQNNAKITKYPEAADLNACITASMPEK